MLRNLWRAFTNHWNLLFVFGMASFAALSGYPVETLLVLAAGEIFYLGFFGVRAQPSSGPVTGRNPQEVMQKTFDALPQLHRERFDELRRRCNKLLQIAEDIHKPDPNWQSEGISTRLTEGLDRHLWQFLRLLHTHAHLNRFLNHNPRRQIENEIREAQKRLSQIRPELGDHQRMLRRSLEDTLKTLHERLANIKQVEDSVSFIEHELDRIENKIKAISEKAVQSHDPQLIAVQIDQAEADMAQAELTIKHARELASIPLVPEEPPKILREVFQRG